MQCNVICAGCSQLPVEPVEAPCCNSIWCWECAINATKCISCNTKCTPDTFVHNGAIARLVERAQTELCVVCANKIPKAQMEQHVAQCPELMVECQLGCKREIKLKDMPHHSSSECDYVPAHCPFAAMGCTAQLRKFEVKEHLETAGAEHLQVLASIVKQQQLDIQALKSATHTNGAVSETQCSAHRAVWAEAKAMFRIWKQRLVEQLLLVLVLFVFLRPSFRVFVCCVVHMMCAQRVLSGGSIRNNLCCVIAAAVITNLVIAF